MYDLEWPMNSILMTFGHSQVIASQDFSDIHAGYPRIWSVGSVFPLVSLSVAKTCAAVYG